MTKKKWSAIGDFVFIKRDEQLSAHSGIDVSERAQVKNMLGLVASSGSGKFVNSGDRVHIPHFKVVDYVIGGDDCAVVRDGDLFAKEIGGVFHPINKYVKTKKCENDHVRNGDGNIVLFHTDKHIETTHWVEIVDVADDCDYVTKEDIGRFCIAPESNDKLQRVLYSKDFMLHESLIEFTAGG